MSYYHKYLHKYDYLTHRDISFVMAEPIKKPKGASVLSHSPWYIIDMS